MNREKSQLTDETKGIRILLADDQAKVRSALQLHLEQEPGMNVVGEATEADELLAQVGAARPDIVLLDWELPGLSRHDVLSALRAHCPYLKVIALSGRPEARQAALEAGVDAFVSKGDPPERLLAAVNDCCRRQHKSKQRGQSGKEEKR